MIIERCKDLQDGFLRAMCYGKANEGEVRDHNP